MQRHILEHVWFLGLWSVVTVLFWAFGLEHIGIPFAMLVAGAILTFDREAIHALPVLLSSLFMVSQTEWSLETIPFYLMLVPVLLIVFFVIHVIRFRVRLFHGKLLFPLVAMLAAMGLSTINATGVDMVYLFLMSAAVSYVFVYLFFRNAVVGNQIQFLLMTMAVLGVIVSLEVFIYYLRVDDVILAIETKSIDLGWGISNFVATYLILFIPATFYFAKISRHHLVWMFLGLFESLMLLFTLSRGGILVYSFLLIFLLIYLFRGTNVKQMVLNVFAILLIIAAVISSNMDLFVAIYDRFRVLLFDSSGRMDLYQEAINQFLAHPLLGAGIYARLDETGGLRMYHNTILHTAASFGILGLLALGWQFVVSFQIMMHQIKTKTTILALSLLFANLHGMVDNVYYMPQFMILFFVILAVTEVSNQHYDRTLERALS